jgi:hypothetical protein
MDYHLEEKEGNVIGSHDAAEMAELFYPQHLENRQTTHTVMSLLLELHRHC